MDKPWGRSFKAEGTWCKTLEVEQPDIFGKQEIFKIRRNVYFHFLCFSVLHSSH